MLVISNLYAQPITLSAKIIWKEKDLYYRNYDKVNVPFLKFTYRNNTDNPLYFYNYTDSISFLRFTHIIPLISFAPEYFSTPRPEPWQVLTDSMPDWSSKKYNVLIEKSDDFNFSLGKSYIYVAGSQLDKDYAENSSIEHKVLDNLTSLMHAQSRLNSESSNLQYEYFHYPGKVVYKDLFSDYTIEQVNDEIKRIEEQWQQSDEYKLMLAERDSMNKNLYPNRVSDRVHRLIEKDIERRCIFLKPHESYSFEFDLTPFFLLNGSYNFILKSRIMPESVTFGNPYVILKSYSLNDEKRFDPKYNDNYYTFSLPSIYNGYKLYTGEIKEVTIHLDLKD